jgi:hypothetical protein
LAASQAAFRSAFSAALWEAVIVGPGWVAGVDFPDCEAGWREGESDGDEPDVSERESTINVTGPSFVNATLIIAPNFPSEERSLDLLDILSNAQMQPLIFAGSYDSPMRSKKAAYREPDDSAGCVDGAQLSDPSVAT